MALISQLFLYQAASVILQADHAIVQAVQDRAYPYWQTQPISGSQSEVWTIMVGSPDAQMVYETWPVSSPDEPKAHVHIVHQAKTIILPDQETIWLIQRALRLIRNILRLQLARAGAIFLHAGMVSMPGYGGIAYVGDKQAGKTSSILAALTQGAHFVTNDDLVILSDGPHLRALGSPRSIRVRHDTLTTLPYPRVTGRPLLSHPLPSERGPEFLCFFPHELAETFQCQLIPETDLRTLVFTSFLPRSSSLATSLRPVSGAEALVLLRRHSEPCTDGYHRFLRTCFPAPTEQQPLEKLIQQVPCYQLQQSFSTLGTALDIICHENTP